MSTEPPSGFGFGRELQLDFGRRTGMLRRLLLPVLLLACGSLTLLSSPAAAMCLGPTIGRIEPAVRGETITVQGSWFGDNCYDTGPPPAVARRGTAWSAVAVAAPDDERFRLEGVEVVRNGRLVLGPVTLSIAARGPVVVAGPSGSGKSSLLRLLNRLDVPSAGSVRYRGEDLSRTDPAAHRRRVAMVFQRPVVLPGTIADNLREADPSLNDAGVAAALDRVGLEPALSGRDARDLSGGEAQRMCLARSLATDPEVVLFDEPTSSLDPASALRIERLADSLDARGITTIWVTHDLDQMRRLAAQVVAVIDGRIAQSGPAAEVLRDPCPAVARFLAGGA